MVTDFVPDPRLPAEATSAVWRIFGSGETSRPQPTSYELIEPIIRSRVSLAQQDEVISEIRAWFEQHGDRWWLKEEKREEAAVLILHGVGDALSSTRGISDQETAFWAVGSVSADLAARIIRSIWSPETIDSFVRYALDTLEALCERDVVLDAARMGYGVPNSRASMSPVDRRNMLSRLRRSEGYDWWLFPGIFNIVELLIRLDCAHFHTLFDRIDHLAIQIRAAHCKVHLPESRDHGEPLQWISRDSPEALVALAIVNVLNSINSLDWESRRRAGMQGEVGELDPTASVLLTRLIDQLALIEPIDCAKWLIDLLDSGMSILNSHSRRGKAPRAEHLEEMCTQLLERLIRESWSDDMLCILRDGLGSNLLAPRTHPLAEIAWGLREVQPDRSAEVARLIMNMHEEHIEEILADGRTLFYNLADWRDQDWISSIGVALALSCEEVDPSAWVEKKCRELPLSVWDAEENPDTFRVADQVAQFRFLVAFDALVPLDELGRKVDPVKVRALAEKLWVHCHFAGQHLYGQHIGTDAAEYAARVAVELGEPDVIWILDQARAAHVDPRTLWGIIDQRLFKNAREVKPGKEPEDDVFTEICHATSTRFGGGRALSLHELCYTARLWLLLKDPEESQHTAMEILSFGNLGPHERTYKILALKLLAFAAHEIGSSPAFTSEIKSIYGQLWSSNYTPVDESNDRQQVDEFLK